MPRKIEITTLSTAEGDEDMCNDRRTCPGVHVLNDRPDVYHLIGEAVTDPEELAAFAEYMGPGETLVTQPRTVIDTLRR